MTIARLAGDHKSRSLVKIRSQCRNLCYTRVSTAASCGYRLLAVELSFHCDVISCQLARRGVRRGTAKASISGGVQRVWWSWLGGRSDLDPWATAVLAPCIAIPFPLLRSVGKYGDTRPLQCSVEETTHPELHRSSLHRAYSRQYSTLRVTRRSAIPQKAPTFGPGFELGGPGIVSWPEPGCMALSMPQTRQWV